MMEEYLLMWKASEAPPKANARSARKTASGPWHVAQSLRCEKSTIISISCLPPSLW